jgi:hypothetical protein
VAGAAACGMLGCADGGKALPDAAPPDAAAPLWWQPKLGAVKDWDIQLSGPTDTSAPRAMYVLDLWALVPAPTQLSYGDGRTISVPAGALAGTIAELHARTPRPIVICHVETGVLDLTLPDAPMFPGYVAPPATIPDQVAPAAGSVIGWRVGTSEKRWLDIRRAAASRDPLLPVLFNRFELAKQIGCDGVEPDRNLAGEFSSFTGFDITAEDSYAWFKELAKQGHDRRLSTGMKNGHNLGGQVGAVAPELDWLMIERCAEGAEPNCMESARPFVDLDKEVFAIDYDRDLEGNAQPSTVVCPRQTAARIASGLYKEVGLTSARTACAP